MYCHDTILHIGAMALSIEVCFTRSPYDPPTRLDPAGGSEIEITGVWTKWITGVDYNLDRAHFQSWAPDLDGLAWNMVEDDQGIQYDLHRHANDRDDDGPN